MEPQRISPFKHVIESQQFDDDYIHGLFTRVDLYKLQATSGKSDFGASLDGKIVAMLFYESSTRTRFSFESAVHKLGGKIIGTENAREFSSASKGETLQDTIRIVGAYADMIVLRHFQDDAAHVAASVSAVPIISAGAGQGQHPTQALLDLYTIQERFKRLSGLHVTVVGDLFRGRTVNSLVYLLSKYEGNSFTFVSPDNSRVKQGIRDHLLEHKVAFTETSVLEPALATADVVYMTRVQKERFADVAEYEAAKGKYVLTQKLVNLMKQQSIILHPLPRVDELPVEVDADPRAGYFHQAANGLYVRMGVLDMLNEGLL